MKRLYRRDVLKSAIAGGVHFGLGPGLGTNRISAAEANSQVRLAIIGLGGIDVPERVQTGVRCLRTVLMGKLENNISGKKAQPSGRG